MSRNPDIKRPFGSAMIQKTTMLIVRGWAPAVIKRFAFRVALWDAYRRK